MPRSVVTFLMFEGRAEEAMKLYASVFRAEAKVAERWGPEGPGREGSIKRGELVLAGHPLVFFDSPAGHAFTFTPSISLFVECESAAELEAAYRELLVDGKALMPIDNYGFSARFGWVQDRFGVSWQLNVA